jgi:hypothetical protein
MFPLRSGIFASLFYVNCTKYMQHGYHILLVLLSFVSSCCDSVNPTRVPILSNKQNIWTTVNLPLLPYVHWYPTGISIICLGCTPYLWRRQIITYAMQEQVPMEDVGRHRRWVWEWMSAIGNIPAHWSGWTWHFDFMILVRPTSGTLSRWKMKENDQASKKNSLPDDW